jgi:hypothetical protein
MLFAEPAVVKTRDGTSYEGDVEQQGDNVIITIHGVRTVIQKSNVESIQPAGDYQKMFRERIEKLAADDAAGRIALAREAFDRRQYDLSRDTLENALAIDPNNAEASRLLNTVQSQIRLERLRSASAPAGGAAGAEPATRPQVAGQAALDRRFLTQADIQAIRRKELKPSDARVGIRFEGDVKRRFADMQNITFAEFTAKPVVDQAIDILTKGEPEMREKVQIVGDPQSIQVYKRDIQPLVLQSCSTIGCHGGPSGGGFVLLYPANSDVVSYTNFYILNSFSRLEGGSTVGEGVFSPSQVKLIERGRGEHSLLANYGLPIDQAEFDHPLVKDRPISPIYRDKDDARYRTVVDWMNNALAQPEPQYEIQFTPPTAAAPPASAAPQGGMR